MKKNARRRQQDPLKHRPFENLRDLIREKNIPLPPADAQPQWRPRKKLSEYTNDMQLFREAMADVIPLRDMGRHHCAAGTAGTCLMPEMETDDAIEALRELVESGKGFAVSLTSEYMEGRGHRVSREINRRLHRGEYSIQAHIDLHGLRVADARDAVDDFLRESLTTGKRAVLIVHGRGLSSPDRPVLKSKVREWLTSGVWRKWVLAFTSARPCDGGAGATYVLLRNSPATRRLRKRRR